MLQRGYERGDLNLVYPLARGTGPLLTFLFAVTVLGERPDAVAVAGVLAVIVGRAADLARWRRTAHRLDPGRGPLGVGTGRGHRGVHALGRPRRHRPRRAAAAVLRARSAAADPGLTLLLGRRRTLLPTVWREARGPVVAVAVLSPLAYVLVLRALQLAPVSLVAPARESSIVVGALLSWWVLREPSARRRLVGAAVVLARDRGGSSAELRRR